MYSQLYWWFNSGSCRARVWSAGIGRSGSPPPPPPPENKTDPSTDNPREINELVKTGRNFWFKPLLIFSMIITPLLTLLLIDCPRVRSDVLAGHAVTCKVKQDKKESS